MSREPSITTWTRLTGRSRRADMGPGLLAAIHDPLWLLARQKQLGAFRAEDAPTPVGVAVEVERTKVTRIRPGGPSSTAAPRDYDGSIPLETVVEREPPRRDEGANLRLAAEAGLRFGDFLADHGAAALVPQYTQRYPIDGPGTRLPDADTARFLQLVVRRIADGNKLYTAFHPAGTPAGTVVVPSVPDATGYPGVAQAATDWSEWYESLVSTAAPADDAWQSARLEYAFALAAPEREGETVLEAREFGGGRLDWYAFDVGADSLGATGGPAPTTVETTLLATPIAYAGMPARRWFEFEDAVVNLAKVDAGPPDLARMLLIEYATLYGNDHFVVPVQLEVGGLCRITSLVVTDNFGGRTRIGPARASSGNGAVRLFELTGDGDENLGTFMFLAPTLGNVIEGVAVEDVRFLRDEMANVAWAVERVVEAPTGRPVDRFEAYQNERLRQPESPPVTQTSAPLTYRLQTRIPPHWIPLLPVTVAPGSHAVRLQLREMLDPESGAPIPPQGVLLDTSTGPFELYEEEVPRAGARVRRAYRSTRWIDGSPHLWLGRTKTVGRGEGSSGLRFDALEPTKRP